MTMIKRIKNAFKYKISLEVKLIASYLILIMILVFTLSIVLHSYYLNAFIKQASDDSIQLTSQINKNIESYFEEIDELSINIAYDERLNESLDDLYFNSKFSNSADEQYLNNLLSNNLFSKKGIFSINIYSTEFNFLAYKQGTVNEYYVPVTQDYLRKAKTNYGKSYIVSRNETQFFEDNFSISLVRPIISLYSFKLIATLVIDVDYNILKDLIKNSETNSSSKIYILNEKDEVLYSEESAEIGKQLTRGLFYKKEYKGNLVNLYDENNNKYLFISQRSNITNQRIVVMIPYSILTKDVDQSIEFIFRVGIFLIIVALLLGLTMANTIMRPIKELQRAFQYVGKSNYTKNEKINGNNEISKLWLGFNTMAKRIDMLIEETINKEDQKRKAEMNALQMQINPHFLYNTLNSIRYLSIIQNANNIKTITTLLISLLKELANVKTDYITLEEEISIVTEYIEIQKLIYLDKFTVSIECPKELFKIRVLKFILQPIIENSIFHGILPSNRNGQIRIKITKTDILKIRIIDNGVGLVNGSIESKNGDKGNHIGLNNLDERIKLFYGNEFGITLRSKINVGTIVEIDLPLSVNS